MYLSSFCHHSNDYQDNSILSSDNRYFFGKCMKPLLQSKAHQYLNVQLTAVEQEKFVMQCIKEAAMFWTTISKIFPLH